MISVAEALARITGALRPAGREMVGLDAALGRVLADVPLSRTTQPPLPVSAMDGYAVRAADVAAVPVRLRMTGTIAAGQSPDHAVLPGTCQRILTGAPLPPGADAIVIQENSEVVGAEVTVLVPSDAGRHIRVAGLDFAAGMALPAAGRRLTARDVALAAAMDLPWLSVFRRPRVAIAVTGDEVVLPGHERGAEQIVSSNGHGLAALVRALGGVPQLLPLVADTADALAGALAQAQGADLIITTGGASVGDHDVVRQAFGGGSIDLDFWKIALRPGKPLLFGRLGTTPVIGLPGNPVSCLVCGLLFVRPALEILQGLPATPLPLQRARLAQALPANDQRQDYIRSSLSPGADGIPVVTPFGRQDSGMLSVLARSDALLVRTPHAPAMAAGQIVDIALFPDGL
jgi:molybdopterin molybdotransferase